MSTDRTRGNFDNPNIDRNFVPEGLYSTIPSDVEANQFREYLPFWVVIKNPDHNEGSRGSDRLHFPEEGTTQDEPEKLCDAAISDASVLSGKDIPVFPRNFRKKCNRCLEEARKRSTAEN